ncbi:MAG: DnaA regulatory inactivator Hda [Gammaproteobacteria bacterium]|nr:MAG: DnaA regulatory inactivator Hda [Gammaproteobacteria bacterium]
MGSGCTGGTQRAGLHATGLDKGENQAGGQTLMFPRQLPLDYRWPDNFSLSHYQDVAEPPLLPLVQAQAEGTSEDMLLYLWGAEDTGKSFLLQAAAQHASDQGRAVMYLPVPELLQWSPDVLDGLETLDLLCIDDIQALSDDSVDPRWPEAFFNLFNRARDAGKCWLVSADRTPRELEVPLADLVSRLQWGVVRQVPRLDESSMFRFWADRARDRGIVLDEDVQQFVMRRAERNLPALMRLLDELDEESLVEKRRITVPFIKKVTGW